MKYKEGRAIRIQNAQYADKLKKIKLEKMKLLQQKGVPAKYHAGLAKMRFSAK